MHMFRCHLTYFRTGSYTSDKVRMARKDVMRVRQVCIANGSRPGRSLNAIWLSVVTWSRLDDDGSKALIKR